MANHAQEKITRLRVRKILNKERRMLVFGHREMFSHTRFTIPHKSIFIYLSFHFCSFLCKIEHRESILPLQSISMQMVLMSDPYLEHCKCQQESSHAEQETDPERRHQTHQVGKEAFTRSCIQFRHR